MAAPTVGAVMEDILPYLGVEQTFTEDDVAGKSVVVEDLTGMTLKEAQKRLQDAHLSCRTVGNGETVTGQIPAAGKTVSGGSEVLLYFGEAPPADTVKVPDFRGMNRQQAADAAAELGLYILVAGNTSLDASVKVASQSVATGTDVSIGTMVRLEFIDTKAAD